MGGSVDVKCMSIDEELARGTAGLGIDETAADAVGH